MHVSFIRTLAFVLALLPALASAQFQSFPPGTFTNRAALSGTAGTGLACGYSPILQADYNVAYTGATPSATGGTPTYVFSNTGTLPTGFTLNTTTGVISGTDSVDSGGATYPGIQLKVTDLALTTVNCAASFTITVAAALTLVSYTPVTTGSVGVSYTGGTPSVTGGSTPIVYSISSGTLPSGLTVNTSTGVITGTPTTGGTQTGLVLTATDNIGVAVNSASFQIAISGAMVTPLLSANGNTTGPANNTTDYCAFVTSNNATSDCIATSTGVRDTPIGVAGTINNLTVRVGNAVAAGTWAVTLYKNDSATTLTCSITSSAQTCSDTSHSVTVVVGDLLTWQWAPTSTPTAQTFLQIGTVFTSTNSGESPIFAPLTVAASTAAVNYQGFAASNQSTTEAIVSSVVPTAGTIDQLYVYASAAPGAAKNWTVSVYHNGALTSGPLSCTMTGTGSANQKCSDLTGGHAFTVATGDTISIRVCPGTELAGVCTVLTPAAANISAGMRWVPTVPGESMLFMNATLFPTVTTAAYGNINGSGITSSTEVNQISLAPNAFTLKKLYVLQSTDPGNTITRTFTVRKNTATSGITCGITGNGSTSLSCNDTSDTYLTSLNDTLDLQTTASSTTAAQTYIKTGIVAYIP